MRSYQLRANEQLEVVNMCIRVSFLYSCHVRMPERDTNCRKMGMLITRLYYLLYLDDMLGLVYYSLYSYILYLESYICYLDILELI